MAAVLRSEEMAEGLNDPALDRLLAALITDRVVYFPIRHHSPACARYLKQIITARRPQAILIEGPASFTSLIPLVLHPQTRSPFAIYTSFVNEPASENDDSEKRASAFGPSRHAAYYPFCDYSPELVALRTGAEVGATLRFIDLDYAAQVRAELNAMQKQSAPRIESLLEERYFKRSRYLQSLARKAGCRDHNDLWDHLFETRLFPANIAAETSPDKFIHDVAAWCYFARTDATADELDADGTLAREAAMASAVRAELASGTARVLVVTGGFHSVVLPGLVAADSPPTLTPSKAAATADVFDCLIRYGFEQLDALNGYAAGMPAPAYYHQLWHAAEEAHTSEPLAGIAARIIVELGRTTRQKKLAVALSPADEIAALEQSRRLAAMRGHPGPTREDLLDGIRSCFVKGAMDAEGAIVLGLAHHSLGGTSIGEVPSEAGAPPLVADFRATAQKLRLNLKDSVRRKSSLDLYRKTAHRQCSRFFHSLVFLGVPFAILAGGPDFVKGTGLERLFEHWDYQWTPQTESRLVEAGIYGATTAEAAANRLVRAIAELEEAGRGRNAVEATGLLIHACRMGLHQHTSRLLQLIATQVNEDSVLESLTNALNQLILLWESREPLEAHRLDEIPQLIRAVYERACYLLHHLANTSPEGVANTLQALLIMRDLLRSRLSADNSLEPELFWSPLAKVPTQANCPPLLCGGVTGLLHGDGRLAEADLLKLLAGSLNAASERAGEQTDFLIGLLRACRELAWRQPALVEAVEKLLAAWSDEEFIERIPHLRMAFADLTPREADQVAAVVARMHQVDKIGALHLPGISEAEMVGAAKVNALVKQALLEDGLLAWIERSDSGRAKSEAET